MLHVGAFPLSLMLAICFQNQVKLSEKLSHVQSLCIHEMIVRAFKHILQAVVSAVSNTEKMAVSIAAALNLMLGVPENKELNKSRNVHSLVWRWLEVFLMKRYEWDLNSLNDKDVRKFAIVRGLCHKVFDTKLQILTSKVFWNYLHYATLILWICSSLIYDNFYCSQFSRSHIFD